jgi:hypothetical protein
MAVIESARSDVAGREGVPPNLYKLRGGDLVYVSGGVGVCGDSWSVGLIVLDARQVWTRDSGGNRNNSKSKIDN